MCVRHPRVLVSFGAVILAVSFASSLAAQPGAPEYTTLAPAQRKILSLDQPILYRGRRTTKRLLLADLKRRFAAGPKTSGEFGDVRAEVARFEAAEKARLDAKRSHVAQQRALVVPHAPALLPVVATRQAIEAEARALFVESKTASPARLSAIEARAAELLRELASAR